MEKSMRSAWQVNGFMIGNYITMNNWTENKTKHKHASQGSFVAKTHKSGQMSKENGLDAWTRAHLLLAYTPTQTQHIHYFVNVGERPLQMQIVSLSLAVR